MCEPVTATAAATAAASTTASTIGYYALAAGVASTLMTGYSMYQQRSAANKQAVYQSQVAANNALTAKYEADYAREATDRKAAQQRLQVSQMVGKQRAAMGSTGIAVDQGSFLDLNLDTVEQGKLDELAILHEGDKAVWRANIEGSNFTAQSGMYEASQSSPFMAAVPGLMSGASQAGLNYYNLTKVK